MYQDFYVDSEYSASLFYVFATFIATTVIIILAVLRHISVFCSCQYLPQVMSSLILYKISTQFLGLPKYTGLFKLCHVRSMPCDPVEAVFYLQQI